MVELMLAKMDSFQQKIEANQEEIITSSEKFRSFEVLSFPGWLSIKPR
jgi:hypothetical protein